MGVVLHLKKPECPETKDALCQFWLNWTSGSGEEDEHVKSLQTDGQIDDGQQAIRKAHLSYQLELSARVS